MTGNEVILAAGYSSHLFTNAHCIPGPASGQSQRARREFRGLDDIAFLIHPELVRIEARFSASRSRTRATADDRAFAEQLPTVTVCATMSYTR
jgi:hypothetical protein